MLKNKLLIGLTALGLSANAQWNGTNPITTNSNVQINDIGGQNIGLSVNGRLQSNNNDGGFWITQNRFIGGLTTNKLGIFNGDWRMVFLNNGNIGVANYSPSSLMSIGSSLPNPGSNTGTSSTTFTTNTGNLGNLATNFLNLANFGFGAGSSAVSLGVKAVRRRNGSSWWSGGTSEVAVGLGMDVDFSPNVFNNYIWFTSEGVGIGNSDPHPNYKLDVNGNLHINGRIDTKDVCVTPSGFCDFVFDENYKLMGLDSLKGYIEKNKHLPHFPSEKQIVKNGMSMTDITLSQTRTIEELVLYTIKQQEIIEKLLKDVAELKTKQ